jgi:hypothetical protein
VRHCCCQACKRSSGTRGGQPQRWESLSNLGVVKADAAAIAYAIERDWLIISGGLHSLSLTENGRRRLKRPGGAVNGLAKSKTEP